MTTTASLAVIDNLYKDSLRAVLHSFGDLYYVDGNINRVKIRCMFGNPERMASRIVADNTMELPILSISEVGTSNADDRRRHAHVMVSKKEWDSETKRATRIVSLAPRPISITYEVAIWTRYKADMDMVRSAVFDMFNPNLEIRTKYSDYNQAFLVDESDVGSVTATDSEDRLLRKTISISLETYLPSPTFRVTSTGQLEMIHNIELE